MCHFVLTVWHDNRRQAACNVYVMLYSRFLVHSFNHTVKQACVTENNTAAAAGSGGLQVFGTPFMVALMEKAAWSSIAPHLAPGDSTVGTKVNISHLSATPVGMKVWCECELVDMDRRRLVFEVTAYDERGVIGQGTHERFIINKEKFQSKVDQK